MCILTQIHNEPKESKTPKPAAKPTVEEISLVLETPIA
jgi:hypothetical protein